MSNIFMIISKEKKNCLEFFSHIFYFSIVNVRKFCGKCSAYTYSAQQFKSTKFLSFTDLFWKISNSGPNVDVWGNIWFLQTYQCWEASLFNFLKLSFKCMLMSPFNGFSLHQSTILWPWHSQEVKEKSYKILVFLLTWRTNTEKLKIIS